MLKRTGRMVAGALGYEMGRRNGVFSIWRRNHFRLGYDREEEAQTSVAMVREHTMLPYERLVTLWQQAAFCEFAGTAGSFVECGVWKGGAVALMALANLKHSLQRRHLHLFDSFEGIPEPNAAVDGASAVMAARRVGAAATGAHTPITGMYKSTGTLEASRQLLEAAVGYPASHLHYHKGWF